MAERAAPPLITAHNGPRTAGEPEWAQLTTYTGGCATGLQFHAERTPLRRGPLAGGGRRGHVTTFSRASRRRMLRTLGSVNRLSYSRAPTLCTVTFPGVYLQKPPQVRRCLRALLKRLRRNFGPIPILWRLEYQERGAPHFHLLVFDPPETEELRRFVGVAWFEIIGTENNWHLLRGADVRPGHSWRGAMAYLSKYLAKESEEGGLPEGHQGRLWGIECRKSLHTAPISYALAVKEALKARRWLLRAAGRRVRGTGPIQRLSVLCGSETVERVVRYLCPEVHSWDGHRMRPPGWYQWETMLCAERTYPAVSEC